MHGPLRRTNSFKPRTLELTLEWMDPFKELLFCFTSGFLVLSFGFLWFPLSQLLECCAEVVYLSLLSQCFMYMKPQQLWSIIRESLGFRV